MTQTSLEVRHVQIAGRDIAVTRVTETQALLVSREGVLLRKEGIDKDRKIRGMTRVLDAVESLIPDEDDREFITDMMLTGQLNLEDLLPVISAFKDEAAVPAKPAVRRGRPRKNPV